MSDERSQKALVTGASGFIGSALVERLRQEGIHVTCVGRNELGPPPWSATMWASSLVQHTPDVVFHLAGQIDDSNEAALRDANVASALGLMAAIDQLKIAPRLIFAGSAAEYGNVQTSAGELAETTICAPQSKYGRSKLEQTEKVLAWTNATGCHTCVARIFNPIGTRLPKRLALGDFAAQIASMPDKGDVLHCGDIDVFRDMMDVEDTAMQLFALSQVQDNPYRVVNICSGVAISLRDAVTALIELSGKQVLIQVDAARIRPGSPKVLSGSTHRLEALGITPKVPTARALAQLVWREYSL